MTLEEIDPFAHTNLPPLTADDLRSSGSFDITSQETLQFQADVINVFEGRVDIETFPPDYQKRIRDYYRFSAVSPESMSAKIAQTPSKRVGK
jgi:hypothetical protein